jgi:DNA-binding beta-propeller fold protein YncE
MDTLRLLLLLSALAAGAAERPGERLLVVEKRAERLSAYDLASGRALWSVPAGRKPHEVALSRDRTLAYVTNYGVDSFSEAGPGANTITVIDLARRENLGEIDLGDSRRPHGIEVGASGRLYVTADQPPRLLVIDPQARKVVRHYDLGQSLPHMLAVAGDERKAYTANSGSGTVSVVALDRDEPIRNIEIGGVPQGFAWSEDGARLFACNRSGNALLVIDPQSDQVTGRLEIPGHPARLRVVAGSPFLVVSLLEAGDVAVVDTRSLKVAHRTHVGSRSEGVTVDPAGRFGYISLQDEDKVVRFSIPDAKVVTEIRTGGKPDPLIVLPAK